MNDNVRAFRGERNGERAPERFAPPVISAVLPLSDSMSWLSRYAAVRPGVQWLVNSRKHGNISQSLIQSIAEEASDMRGKSHRAAGKPAQTRQRQAAALQSGHSPASGSRCFALC